MFRAGQDCYSLENMGSQGKHVILQENPGSGAGCFAGGNRHWQQPV